MLRILGHRICTCGWAGLELESWFPWLCEFRALQGWGLIHWIQHWEPPCSSLCPSHEHFWHASGDRNKPSISYHNEHTRMDEIVNGLASHAARDCHCPRNVLHTNCICMVGTLHDAFWYVAWDFPCRQNSYHNVSKGKTLVLVLPERLAEGYWTLDCPLPQ